MQGVIAFQGLHPIAYPVNHESSDNWPCRGRTRPPSSTTSSNRDAGATKRIPQGSKVPRKSTRLAMFYTQASMISTTVVTCTRELRDIRQQRAQASRGSDDVSGMIQSRYLLVMQRCYGNAISLRTLVVGRWCSLVTKTVPNLLTSDNRASPPFLMVARVVNRCSRGSLVPFERSRRVPICPTCSCLLSPNVDWRYHGQPRCNLSRHRIEENFDPSCHRGQMAPVTIRGIVSIGCKDAAVQGDGAIRDGSLWYL